MQNRSPENIIGPDVNEYRGNIDYKLLATKTPYAYARASGSGTGRFRIDRKFIDYVKGFKTVGIISGGYHYAVPSYDLTTADRQCDDFIGALEDAYGVGNYGELFPVIDIETPIDKSISTDALPDWVDRFRKRFERKTRRVLMIYTGAFFIDLYNNFYHSKKGYILSDMPLWIAMYPEMPGNPLYPKDQGGWTRWTIWQFTQTGNISGVNPPVDLNYGPKNLDYLVQPRNVTGLKAYHQNNNIYVSWNKNTDEDLNGYNIFLNSEYVGSAGKNATKFTIKLSQPFNPKATYQVTVEAFDQSGDFSKERAKVLVQNRSEITSYDLPNENKEIEKENHSDIRKSNYFNSKPNEHFEAYYDEDDDLYYYPVKIHHPYEYDNKTQMRGYSDGLVYKYKLKDEKNLDEIFEENQIEEEYNYSDNEDLNSEIDDIKNTNYNVLEREIDNDLARTYSYKLRKDGDEEKLSDDYCEYDYMYTNSENSKYKNKFRSDFEELNYGKDFYSNKDENRGKKNHKKKHKKHK